MITQYAVVVLWLATTQTNKRETKLRGVCRSRLDYGLFYGSVKQENHGKPKVTVNGDLIPNSKSTDQRLTVN